MYVVVFLEGSIIILGIDTSIGQPIGGIGNFRGTGDIGRCRKGFLQVVIDISVVEERRITTEPHAQFAIVRAVSLAVGLYIVIYTSHTTTDNIADDPLKASDIRCHILHLYHV
jgi:hypothetical protein